MCTLKKVKQLNNKQYDFTFVYTSQEILEQRTVTFN